MNEYRLQIELVGPLLAPTVEAAWQADTIFGHVCWALLRHRGDRWLADFLASCRSGAPPLVLSNGFPSGMLPRPLWTDAPVREQAKDAALLAMARAKRQREHGLIPEADFGERCRGGQRGPEFAPSRVVSGIRQHSTVSRGGGVIEEGGLYAQPESWTPQVTVYARANESGYAALESFAQYLEFEGYGKRRSVGYGAVRRVEIEVFSGFPFIPHANGFVSLSNFIPDRGDPTDGRWRLLVKRGRLGDERSTDENPFKRPLVFLTAGSCFRSGPPRPWYGSFIQGVAPGRPDVLQYALAYAVPVHVPDTR